MSPVDDVTIPCRYFAKGNCFKGSHCHFAHINNGLWPDSSPSVTITNISATEETSIHSSHDSDISPRYPKYDGGEQSGVVRPTYDLSISLISSSPDEIILEPDFHLQSFHISSLINRPDLCKRLQIFQAGHCKLGFGTQMTDERLFRDFINACPSLREINLHSFIHLSDITLSAVVQHCTEIETIHISGKITREGKIAGFALEELMQDLSLAPRLTLLGLLNQNQRSSELARLTDFEKFYMESKNDIGWYGFVEDWSISRWKEGWIDQVSHKGRRGEIDHVGD
ncbi:hypothetical protein M422DRAFT_271676 [Sphaerobolus stellatus SS14]|uniref:Unplaced genomic scaffold SPHSTscaffold_269, whole genome shotgun sequence n=1 Tax=Sphaerobolus stellatus (strain SS14) TaxID=990650 RepID=A0A0C9UPB9_SPHS4|nr:hypothetical protein M422DRAFT_271676 [Sphaerobolus stellatus SS14]